MEKTKAAGYQKKYRIKKQKKFKKYEGSYKFVKKANPKLVYEYLSMTENNSSEDEMHTENTTEITKEITSEKKSRNHNRKNSRNHNRKNSRNHNRNHNSGKHRRTKYNREYV